MSSSFSSIAWFCWSSLFQDACGDLLPQSYSGRLITGCWWAAIYIIIASYTASLGSILISNGLTTEINNVVDLGNQEQVKYGMKRFLHQKINTVPTKRENFANIWGELHQKQILTFFLHSTKSNSISFQSKIVKGALQQTSSYSFFCTSNVDVYQRMCKKMQQWNTVVTNSLRGYDLVSKTCFF